MKYAFISDLHIKQADDEAAEILKRFLRHEKTLESDNVILLGDIFDLLVGNHRAYIKQYDFFFKGIVDLLNTGKKVVYIEGNHDFHFKRVLLRYLKKNTEFHKNFEYLKTGRVIDIKGEKYLYCHGYEVDYYNKYFKRWYRIYSSPFFDFFISNILSWSFIQWVGSWASQNSKNRGKKAFDYEKMKEKYLAGAKVLIEERKLKGVIAGHTHVEEFHKYENGTAYYNCGFPLKHRHFLFLNEQGFEKIYL